MLGILCYDPWVFWNKVETRKIVFMFVFIIDAAVILCTKLHFLAFDVIFVYVGLEVSLFGI